MIEKQGQTLLVDVPNGDCPPFQMLDDGIWDEICRRTPPYDKICGIYFTHNHPDHCDLQRLRQFLNMSPDVPFFVPNDKTTSDQINWGPFRITYQSVDHAPIPQAPAHVVTLIETKSQSLYLPADAILDPSVHTSFLGEKQATYGIWNAMFLSRACTRELMRNAAKHNFIYHMPSEKNDSFGIWKKCQLNFQRYSQELMDIKVMDTYPSVVV